MEEAEKAEPSRAEDKNCDDRMADETDHGKDAQTVGQDPDPGQAGAAQAERAKREQERTETEEDKTGVQEGEEDTGKGDVSRKVVDERGDGPHVVPVEEVVGVAEGEAKKRPHEGEQEDTAKDIAEPAVKVVKTPKPAPDVSLDFLSSSPSFSPRLLAANASAFRPHYEDAARGAPAYLKGCKFSPDGLCVLAAASDDAIRIFEPPPPRDEGSAAGWAPCLTMKEGEVVYDFCWHPRMDSAHRETSCFLSTAQYQPVHLYDAYDGSVRASYRCFNHLDEMAAANSVAFHPQGDRIYVGLKNEVRIFDVSIPGRDFLESRPTWVKKEGGWQPGIVSCIAPNPFLSNVYALGSYSKTVGVYCEPDGTPLVLLQGQAGGVTHLQFSGDGSKLLAGGRKDPEILVWDMRNPGQLYAVLKRPVNTNQRVYFDIHPANPRWVVSGSTDNTLRIWDVGQAPSKDGPDGVPVLEPVWTSSGLHQDCINGASFHPTEPILVTSSGQRHATPMNDSDSDEDSGYRTKWECSLKLWDFRL